MGRPPPYVPRVYLPIFPSTRVLIVLTTCWSSLAVTIMQRRLEGNMAMNVGEVTSAIFPTIHGTPLSVLSIINAETAYFEMSLLRWVDILDFRLLNRLSFHLSFRITHLVFPFLCTLYTSEYIQYGADESMIMCHFLRQ